MENTSPQAAALVSWAANVSAAVECVEGICLLSRCLHLLRVPSGCWLLVCLLLSCLPGCTVVFLLLSVVAFSMHGGMLDLRQWNHMLELRFQQESHAEQRWSLRVSSWILCIEQHLLHLYVLERYILLFSFSSLMILPSFLLLAASCFRCPSVHHLSLVSPLLVLPFCPSLFCLLVFIPHLFFHGYFFFLLSLFMFVCLFVCLACSGPIPNCAVCSSATSCSQCGPGYGLLNNNQCVQSCPDGKYFSTSSSTGVVSCQCECCGWVRWRDLFAFPLFASSSCPLRLLIVSLFAAFLSARLHRCVSVVVCGCFQHAWRNAWLASMEPHARVAISTRIACWTALVAACVKLDFMHWTAPTALVCLGALHSPFLLLFADDPSFLSSACSFLLPLSICASFVTCFSSSCPAFLSIAFLFAGFHSASFFSWLFLLLVVVVHVCLFVCLFSLLWSNSELRCLQQCYILLTMRPWLRFAQ